MVFLGTQKIQLDLAGLNPTTGALEPGYTRHFETVAQLNRKIVDARVWVGYHYRESVVEGVVIGKKVAQSALKHYFLPD